MDEKLKVYNTIQESSTIGIASHVNPDGDNLGSCVAMLHALKNLGKKVYFLDNDEVPEDFHFLDSVKDRFSVDSFPAALDLLIVLDSSDFERIGESHSKLLEISKTIVNIDHHRSNQGYGDYNLVMEKATSTGEVVYDFLTTVNLPITEPMATALYTAISTDTGSFQYDSVNSKTHRIIADLYDKKADSQLVVQNLYQSKSVEKVRLMARVLDKIEFFFDGLVAFSSCTQEDLNETGAKSSDTEGIIEQIRNIKGVELAVFVKEKENLNRISLRSKSFIDCTKVASVYSGGGHVRASGATSYDSLSKTKETLLKRIEQVL